MKKVIILIILLVFMTACGNKKEDEIVCYKDNEKIILTFNEDEISKIENIYTHEKKEDALDTYRALGENLVEGSKYKMDNNDVYYYYGEYELSFVKNYKKDKIISTYKSEGYVCN